MAIDKSLISGSTAMLILKLLESRDMYGYEMIDELKTQSNNAFSLKAGTLYPLLHSLEESGMVTSYDQAADSTRIRKYYHITSNGIKRLSEKRKEWESYENAVNSVLKGGVIYGIV